MRRAIVESSESSQLSSEVDMTDITLTTGTASASSAVPMLTSRVVGRWKDAGPPPAAKAEPQPRKDDNPRHQRSPLVPFLISTIIHTLALITLALVTYTIPFRSGVGVTARIGDTASVVRLETIHEVSASEVQRSGANADEPIDVHLAASEPSAIQLAVESAVVKSEDEFAELPAVILNHSGGQTSSLTRLPGGGLSGRAPERRIELGKKYGASEASEQAVDEALRYLAAHQRNDGSWSFNLKLDPCNGQCSHSTKGGDSPAPSTAATGLALLAFLGAGHTHLDGSPYAQTVRRGIYFLRSVAAETDAGYDWQKGSMYGHGIALMALGEALSMTTERGKERESDLYELVEKGSQFSCIAQHFGGSWGYYPNSPGDTTVTGWQVLSLIAAKRSRVDLQTRTLEQAKEFLFTTSKERKFWFGYKGPPGEPTTTAIALTLLLYLGETPDYTPMMIALSDMAQRGPTLNNIYHDYYATLALHHSRHRDWDTWNQKLRDHLVKTQVHTGHESGSWHFEDKYGDVGGRLYTTAMCALTLEVYYRYLPLYEPIEEFPID